MALGLGWKVLILKIAMLLGTVIVLMTPTVDLKIGRLNLLLVTLGQWSLAFLLVAFGVGFILALLPLSLCCVSAIKQSGLAFHARVVKVFLCGIIDAARVEALNVLPRIAGLAVYGITIVVRIIADALDGVRLFLYRIGNRRRIATLDGRCGMEDSVNGLRELRG